MANRVRVLVGRRIRELREAKGWSQEKLGEEADLHRTYIGQVERGEKNIGVENLVRLAKALGSTAAAVLTGIR